MSSRFDFACVLFFAVVASAACADSEKGAGSAADEAGLIGNPAPDFHAKTVTGSKETVSLKELHGQVVLLDFWGTFCEPCKKSFPKLEELNRKYAGSGLRVIGISEDEEDDRDKIPGFASTYGAKFSAGVGRRQGHRPAIQARDDAFVLHHRQGRHRSLRARGLPRRRGDRDRTRGSGAPRALTCPRSARARRARRWEIYPSSPKP